MAALITVPPAFGQPPHDPTDLDADGVPGVAGPRAPGSEVPEVFALSTTGSLLIDRSHGEGSFVVSGFTGYLEAEGWSVDELLTGPITESALSPYDVVMVPVGSRFGIASFTAAEVAAVSAYLSSGGGLWLLNEYDTDPTGINSLSNAFGVAFFQDQVRDSTNNEGEAFWPTIHLLEDHEVTGGVSSYGYYAGCCLSVDPPSTILGSADDDAFSSSCSSFPPTLAVYETSGRVVFSGDVTPLHPSYYPENLREEEELLLQNIVNWLAQKPPTATTATSWGQVKMLYPPR